MPYGAFAPLPLRLGGSATEGWTASQQSRAVADLVAIVRAAPLAVLTLTRSGSTYTVEKYHGQNGVGLAHAPTATEAAPGVCQLTWAKSYKTERYLRGVREDEDLPWVVRQAQTWTLDTVNQQMTCEVTYTGDIYVYFLDDTSAVVEVWGSWLRLPQIGSYGGDPNKEDSKTEAVIPYAAVIYTDLQGMRGSAYTTRAGTLVHAENLALARFWGYFAYRLPEKVRANAVPSRSDEGLSYWVTVLGVTAQPTDEKWLLRQRASVAYQVSTGPIYDTVQSTLQGLLGDNFVAMYIQDSSPLSTPPSPTCWPGVNPGTPTYDIGGGPWYSRRSHLVVQVRTLPAQTTDAFLRLLNVDMFTQLDRLLPAWMTFSWTTGTSFLLDISRLDFDGLS